jgi:diguanylate cyclase (GGDEF)-like protein
VPVNHRSGHRAAPNPHADYHRDDGFVAAHPDTTAVLVLLTALLALLTPAILVLAVVLHLTALVLAGTVASLLLFGGYLAAVWRRRDLRWQLDAARRDPVTGMPTRTVAEDALHAATAAGTRLTVALADVDGLRPVNNGLGHAAGDQLLHTVASRLARAVPAGGLLARLGGDEFVLLAPDTDPDTLATAIGAALAGPATIAGHRMQPRASVGVATTDGLIDAHLLRDTEDADDGVTESASSTTSDTPTRRCRWSPPRRCAPAAT